MNKKSTFIAAIITILFAVNLRAQVTITRNSMDIYNLSTEEGNAMIVDGKADENFWSNIPFQNITHPLVNDAFTETPPATNGYEAKFKAAYDEYYLYTYIEVKDNTPIYFDGTTSATNVDNIEFYFSGEEPSDSYKNPKNTQLRMFPGVSDPYKNYATGYGYVMTMVYDNLLSGFYYETSNIDGGYTMEAIIPWETVLPEEFLTKIKDGDKILFDINASNCTTTTSGRSVILGWSTPDFHDWTYNRYFGDLNFKGNITSRVESEQINHLKYTIRNNTLQLFNAELLTPISIYNISGKLIKSTTYNSNGIDISNLANGIYIVKIGNYYIKINK